MKFIRYAIISLFVTAFLSPINAFANNYEFEKTWTPLFDRAGDPATLCGSQAVEGQRGRAGFMNRVYYKFNGALNTFDFEVLFEECSGHMPDGFFLVVNDGPNPKGHAGELAIIFVDAKDINNPIVTVYAYNGSNSLSSYYYGQGRQPSDRIHSTHPSVGDTFLKSISITDSTRTNSDSSVTPLREYKLSIDANDIVNHSPIYPGSTAWDGILMGNKVGVWFHPVSKLRSSYCVAGDAHSRCQEAPSQDSEGYLKSYGFSKIGSYDTNYQTTNAFPICTSAFQGHTKFNKDLLCYEVPFDEKFGAEITVTDTDSGVALKTINGLPTGAMTTETAITTPPSLLAEMMWTPQATDAGSRHDIEYIFTDDEGAETSCPFSICVPQNLPPECDLSITSSNPNECSGLETTLTFDGSSSVDPEGKPLTYTWTTTCDDGASLSTTTGSQTSLTLTTPGTGQAQNCTISLTVSDGFSTSSTCSLPVAVDSCELDCLNNPNGTAVVDQCGVCDGDGTSCLDCAGTVNGDAAIDLCGVCNGTNDCLDCAGTPNGSTRIDICDVCGGDNTSCLDCKDTDITEIQFKIDGGAKALEGFINQLLIKFKRSPNQALKDYVTETQARANALQVRNWVISWTFPSIQSDCGDTPACVSVSNLDLINEYKEHNLELLQISDEVSKRFFRFKRKRLRKRGAPRSTFRRLRNTKKRYEALFLTQYQENEDFLAQVPQGYSSCN